MSPTPEQRWTTTALAPPRRLGEMLSRARADAGTPLGELADRAPAEWSLARLASVERGSVELDDRQLATLAALYGVDVAAIVPSRSRLVVDLDEGVLRVDGSRSAALGAVAGRDEVLARYLALVCSMRGAQPGDVLTLRADDLASLGRALGTDPDELAVDLDGLMRQPSPAVEGRHGVLRAKVLVPAAGLLVAFCGTAALVLLPDDAPPPAGPPATTASSAAPPAATATAAVQDRLADGRPGPVTPRTSAEAPAPEIIDPAVETR